MIRHHLVLFVVLLATVAIGQETVLVPVGERQLFLDDHGIAKIDGLQRTMHQPKKRGAVIEPDQPWEKALQTRSAPAWDEAARRYKSLRLVDRITDLHAQPSHSPLKSMSMDRKPEGLRRLHTTAPESPPTKAHL